MEFTTIWEMKGSMIFSRESDEMYSKWAMGKHGFPSGRLDDDMNENQESDDENTSIDENQNLKDFILE